MPHRIAPDPTRRRWLAGGLALAAGLPGARLAFGAPTPGGSDAPRLVVVLLRGALDGLGAVPAVGDPQWAARRPQAAAEAERLGAPLRLDDTHALHPRLAGLHRWWRKGQLAVVHAVAQPYRERSHFDAQQMIESGGERPFALDTGWLGRALAAAGQPGLALLPSVPLALRGSPLASNWGPSREREPDEDLLARLQRLYARDTQLAPLWSRALAQRGMAAALDELPEPAARDRGGPGAGAGLGGSADAGSVAGAGPRMGAPASATGSISPPTMTPSLDAGPAGAARPATAATTSGPIAARRAGGFPALARQAGQFLSHPEGPRLAWLELGGWDTHSGQSARLAGALGTLDEGLAALRSALGTDWARTTVLVMTEFGRSAALNGTGGTDHGTGGVAFLAGGRVRGGQVVSDWPGLAPGQLLDGRDLRPTLDLRRLQRAVLEAHWPLGRARIEREVLPGAPPALPGLFTA